MLHFRQYHCGSRPPVIQEFHKVCLQCTTQVYRALPRSLPAVFWLGRRELVFDLTSARPPEGSEVTSSVFWLQLQR